MDAKEAVKSAKGYVSELLAPEGVANLGLEEIEYDDDQHVWNITIGFTRPWNGARNGLAALAGEVAARRTYRVVKIRDTDGHPLSMKQRPEIQD
jgi:hypothetical protein